MMTESQEQKAFVEWYRWWAGDNAPPLMSIPNERKASYETHNHLRQMGLLAGAPDLFIPWPKHGFHGLFIEMKSATGRPTKRQLEVHADLKKWGYAVFVCHGFDAAKAVMEAYAKGVDGEDFREPPA